MRRRESPLCYVLDGDDRLAHGGGAALISLIFGVSSRFEIGSVRRQVVLPGHAQRAAGGSDNLISHQRRRQPSDDHCHHLSPGWLACWQSSGAADPSRRHASPQLWRRFQHSYRHIKHHHGDGRAGRWCRPRPQQRDGPGKRLPGCRMQPNIGHMFGPYAGGMPTAASALYLLNASGAAAVVQPVFVSSAGTAVYTPPLLNLASGAVAVLSDDTPPAGVTCRPMCTPLSLPRFRRALPVSWPPRWATSPPLPMPWRTRCRSWRPWSRQRRQIVALPRLLCAGEFRWYCVLDPVAAQ